MKNKATPQIKSNRGITAEKIPNVDLIKKPEIYAPTIPNQLFASFDELKKSLYGIASSKREYEIILRSNRIDEKMKRSPTILFFWSMLKRGLPFPLFVCLIFDFLLVAKKDLTSFLSNLVVLSTHLLKSKELYHSY